MGHGQGGRRAWIRWINLCRSVHCTALNLDAPFSVSIWAYPTANDLVTLVSKMDDGAGHRGFDVLFEAGKFSTHLVNHWPDNGLKVLTKKAFAINQWHHVLVTSDGSKKAAEIVYVDGKPEPVDAMNDTLRDTLKTEKPLHIGRRGASLISKANSTICNCSGSN